MAKQFTPAEWNSIREKFKADPERYGLPKKEYGSVLMGSFNIRKLGSSRSRNPDTWEFLANVNFPFLDVHPGRDDVFRTNARLTETFDQIGLFSRDPRLPSYTDNASMGAHPLGPDYGVFEFGDLFSQAILGSSFRELSARERRSLVPRFEHKVSDHLPLWVRLPLPTR